MWTDAKFQTSFPGDRTGDSLSRISIVPSMQSKFHELRPRAVLPSPSCQSYIYAPLTRVDRGGPFVPTRLAFRCVMSHFAVYPPWVPVEVEDQHHRPNPFKVSLINGFWCSVFLLRCFSAFLQRPQVQAAGHAETLHVGLKLKTPAASRSPSKVRASPLPSRLSQSSLTVH
jgi:hypothetical protein